MVGYHKGFLTHAGAGVAEMAAAASLKLIEKSCAYGSGFHSLFPLNLAGQDNSKYSKALSGNRVSALPAFLKQQHSRHTGGYLVRIVGDIDDSCLAVSADDIDGI